MKEDECPICGGPLLRRCPWGDGDGGATLVGWLGSVLDEPPEQEPPEQDQTRWIRIGYERYRKHHPRGQ